MGKEGGDHGQVFISTVCTMPSIDQVLCGVRDDPSDSSDTLIKNRNLVEFLQPTATRVTIKLRSSGGRHRAEGVIYDITEGVPMRTNTYLVHDQETGEVAHLHVEPSDLESSLEEIIHLADRRGTQGLVATSCRRTRRDRSQHASLTANRRRRTPQTGLRHTDGGPSESDLPRRYVPE